MTLLPLQLYLIVTILLILDAHLSDSKWDVANIKTSCLSGHLATNSRHLRWHHSHSCRTWCGQQSYRGDLSSSYKKWTNARLQTLGRDNPSNKIINWTLFKKTISTLYLKQWTKILYYKEDLLKENVFALL